MIWLGDLGIRATTGHSPTERDFPRSLTVGFSLTKDWPVKLHELLLPFISKRGPFLGNGLSGWIRKELDRLSPAKKAIIRPALAELARSRARVWSFGVDQPPEADLVSAGQARKMLGSHITLSRVYELADENAWYANGTSSGWLARSKVKQWIQESRDRRERPDRLPLNSLRSKLGTHPHNLRRMIELGVFGAAATDRQAITSGNPFVYKTELSAFLNAIKISLQPRNAGKCAVTYTRYNRTAETGTIDLPTVLKAVIDGRIRPVGRQSHQIGRLTFCLEDLRNLARELRTSDGGGDAEQQMRVPEVASALGVDTRILGTAVQLRLLKCRIGRTGARLITIADTKAFLATYTCSSLIAKEQRAHGISVGFLLSRARAQRIGGKKAKGIPMFRISDLQRLDIGAVLVKATPATRALRNWQCARQGKRCINGD